MSRYIDADALDIVYEDGDMTCVRNIDAMQTVDAVPVVRCGECERRYKPMDDDARNEIYCKFMGSTMRKDDFCSRGFVGRERRTDGV